MEERGSRGLRPGGWIALTIVALVVVVTLAALAVTQYRDWTREAPSYPTLSDSPDPSLLGTVAYYDAGAACVRLVDASGGQSIDAYCLAGTPEGSGSINGPQLAWRPDGRLEVTAFDWPEGGDPTGAWQRLIDVTTGEVEEVPQTDLPSIPDPRPPTATGPDGQEATLELRDHRLVIDVLTDGQTRTLLTSEKYSTDFGLTPSNELVWSPNGQYLLFSDGRLLLTTVAEPATTRILVQSPGAFGCCFASLGIRSYAVTDAVLVAQRT